MKTDSVQRWRNGRASYRPAREVITTSDFEVAAIESDRTAKDFVTTHHYSGSYPAARFRYGLYLGGDLVGVAVFSVPANYRTFDVLPGEVAENVELGRFVLLDEIGANAESWFIARCFERLRAEGIVGVVSFSDPVPRSDADGIVTFPGHIGTIYQATNGTYLGTSKPKHLMLLPDGSSFHPRARSKVRFREKGFTRVVERLEYAGAPAYDDSEEWLGRALATVTRRVRHSGNHKYVWALHRRDRRHLPDSRPYPKIVAA